MDLLDFNIHFTKRMYWLPLQQDFLPLKLILYTLLYILKSNQNTSLAHLSKTGILKANFFLTVNMSGLDLFRDYRGADSYEAKY